MVLSVITSKSYIFSSAYPNAKAKYSYLIIERIPHFHKPHLAPRSVFVLRGAASPCASTHVYAKALLYTSMTAFEEFSFNRNTLPQYGFSQWQCLSDNPVRYRDINFALADTLTPHAVASAAHGFYQDHPQSCVADIVTRFSSVFEGEDGHFPLLLSVW